MAIQITQTSGAEQSTPVYQAFPYGIRFYCTNDGVPQADIAIEMQCLVAPSGASGTFSGGQTNFTVTSGSDGYTSSVGMLAGGVEGTWEVSVYLWIPYQGPSKFNLTNTAPSGTAVPTSVGVSGGDNQTVAPSTALPVNLQATVRDQYGAAVGAGINVTATAPASGASGTFSTGTNTKTVATNGSGVVDFGTFTANATIGAFYVNLTSAGLSSGKALVTIKAPTAEVCTPPSKMTLSGETGADWRDMHYWFAGVAQSNNDASIPVSGTSTPAQDCYAYSFDATQLANIKNLAEITSMTLAFWRYTDGASRPTRFNALMSLASRGAITATQSCSNGLGSTWESFSKQWTSFTNTGNPSNKLYGMDLKNDNLQAVLRFTGNDGGNGTFYANGATLVICYINPEGGEEQSLQLCIL